MCGPSAEQEQTYALQNQFTQQLMQEYSTVFGENQGILSQLTSAFEPILNAGPNQPGFSPAENTALMTQAKEGTAQNYENAAKALSTQIAARGGGSEFIPSGADDAVRAQLASSAAQEESSLENTVTTNNYATGRANYLQAAKTLGSTASLQNPLGYAGASTTSVGNQAQTANQIAASENAWMGPVFGAIGGLAGGIKIPGLSGSGG